MAQSQEPICEFVAIIPPLQGAIKHSGEGDSRILLEAPASELAEVMKLIAFGREKALKVRIEAE